MKRKIAFSALEGLNSAHTAYKGSLVLLSYNHGEHRCKYTCGHTSDLQRTYRCPPELVETARACGILAQTENLCDVIIFDPANSVFMRVSTIMTRCPCCVFAELLPRRPTCALCGAGLVDGQMVVLREKKVVISSLVRRKLKLPATVMHLAGGKAKSFLCCTLSPYCRRTLGGLTQHVFHKDCIEYIRPKTPKQPRRYRDPHGIQDSVGEIDCGSYAL